MKNFIKATTLFLGLTLFGSSCAYERVDSGFEGIKVNLYGSDKGVDDAVLVTGAVWYNPFTTEVHEYPTYVQTQDYEAFTINAKDGSEFYVDPTVSLRIEPGSAPTIFKKYRKPLDEIVSTTLYNYTKNAFREGLSNYTTDEIVSNREVIEQAIEKKLREELLIEHFVVDNLTTGLKYPETIVAAVNAKNEAVQNAIKANNELKIAEAEARRKIIEANAEKEANEIKSKALTPQILRAMYLEKWDGKLPKMVSGKEASILISE